MRSSGPSWPPRSRSSRCAATASTRRCCSATSSCRPTPSDSASTSPRAPGPVAEHPLRTRADLERLRPLDGRRRRLRRRHGPPARRRTPADVPLLAFAGAPFTVASYLIEGRPSKDYRHTKALIHTDEVLWHEIMERLAESAITFIDAQLSNGAARSSCSIRGPDRSAGATTTATCSPTPAACSTSCAIAIPTPRRSTSASGATTCSNRCTPPARPCSVSTGARRSVDARRRLGDDLVVQGNLDPALVLAGVDAGARRRRRRARATTMPMARTGHIFNLGHGVHPRPTRRAAGGRRPRPRADDRDSRHERTARPAPVAVVLMAYGTPGDPSEIEAYYTDIRRGRPPTPEALADLTARYVAIGGVSPLAELTEAQRHALQRALDDREPGRFTVSLGMKHADPKVEVAAAAAVERRRRAPSSGSCSHLTTRRTRSASTSIAAGPASTARCPVVGIESWATEPAFVDVPGRRSRRPHRRRCARRPAATSACSSPLTRCRSGSSTAVTRTPTNSGRRRWRWPTASIWPRAPTGRSRGSPPAARPSRGSAPTSSQVIDELGDGGDVGGVIVCACGFVADHLEVLYDLDIEAAARAARGRPRLRSHGQRQRRPERHGSAGTARDRSVAADRSDRRHDRRRERSSRGRRHRRRDRRPRRRRSNWRPTTGADVVVFEAADRVGGRIDGTPFAGVDHVEAGADAFLARVPEAVDLAREVGLGDDLVSPEAGRRGGLVRRAASRFPDGLLLGVPGRLAPARDHQAAVVARQGYAPALEPLLPRTSIDSRLDRRARAGPVRRRGARTPRRRTRRQHLRHRHRPLQPARGAPAVRRRLDRNAACCWPHGAERGAGAATATRVRPSPIFATPRGGTLPARIGDRRRRSSSAGGDGSDVDDGRGRLRSTADGERVGRSTTSASTP